MTVRDFRQVPDEGRNGVPRGHASTDGTGPEWDIRVTAPGHHNLRYQSHRFLTTQRPMLAPRPDHSAAFGDLIDGRHILRSVKIRLGLTLIAVAIVPLAALAPIVRSILDDPRIAQRERLGAQSDHVALVLQRELESIKVTLHGIAAMDTTGPALTAASDSAAASAAAKAIASALGRPSGVIANLAIADPAGNVHASTGTSVVPFSGLPPPRPGEPPYRVVPGSADGQVSLEVVVPIRGSAGSEPIGSVVASVPLEALIRWSNMHSSTVADRLVVLDAMDTPLVSISTAAEEDADGAPAIAFTANSTTQAQGRAELVVPGLSGWHLVASAPLTVAVLPWPMLATLTVLLLLLVVAIWWMARRIVAPAAALEAQRTQFQALYMSAREAALQDSLTGLGNHRAFQEAVGRMVEQSRRYGNVFSLLLMDIDEFKRVNDTRGHAVGDELLMEVGDLIRASIRGSDAGFRIGGDEFAILMAETDAAGAAVTARRILSLGLEDRGTGRYRGSISFSAGVTECPTFGKTRIELTAQADAALYRGKRAGRTIVSVYDASIDHGHVDEGMRSELSASISAVIESGGLSSVYQPIVHLPTGRILGYEGLVRVNPGTGFQHTGALFDAAEIAGRVLDLDRAALEVVLGGAHEIPLGTLVSLNVSPRSLEAPEFTAATFLAILQRHRMAPERVLLELTERDAIRDPDRLRGTIRTLQDAGVRVAADDVGAGNAGLRLLSQFRFDVVKIDLSLVQGGANQDQTMSVLTSLVDLARGWGALTIAEGVETAAQLQMIRQLGIDAGQGYLLGRPGAVLAPGDVDLDALAGVPKPIEIGVGPPSAVRPPMAFPLPVISPAPRVPTAASVLAGESPSIFNPR